MTIRSFICWKTVLILALCAAACGKDNVEKKEDKKEKKEERVPVEVATVVRGKIEAVIQASTNLEAEAQVQVFSRTSNLVTELMVEEGYQVEKGKILLKLEDDSQKTTLAKTKARLDRAQKEYGRKKDLAAKELITAQEYNDADYELKQAQLEYDEAALQLSYTEIQAPIGGTITSRLVKLGDQVNVNQHLFDIIDFGSIVARVYLPERNLARLAIGQKARITTDALEGKEFQGVVDKIAPTVDAKTGTVKVTVAVHNVGMLRPGMYVNVSLVLDTHENALLLPKRALVYDADQVFVFRLNQEQKVDRLLLQPVLIEKDFVEPGAGIEEGDRVVVAGQTGLKNGAQVKVLGEPEPENAADTTAKAGEPSEAGANGSGSETAAATEVSN